MKGKIIKIEDDGGNYSKGPRLIIEVPRADFAKFPFALGHGDEVDITLVPIFRAYPSMPEDQIVRRGPDVRYVILDEIAEVPSD